MLRKLRDGEADILAAYSVDRYSRQGVGEDGEVVRVIRRGTIEAARNPGTPPPRVVFMREGIDSATDPANWAMRFGMASEMAYGERELIRTRQVAARDRMRREGRNAGHGIPPFGYRTGPHPALPVGRGLHPIPEEATIVREVAARVIAEESMAKIAADLTARGIPTAHSPARLAALAQDARDRGDKTDKTNLRGAWLLDTDPARLSPTERAEYWEADGDGWRLRAGQWTPGTHPLNVDIRPPHGPRLAQGRTCLRRRRRAAGPVHSRPLWTCSWTSAPDLTAARAGHRTAAPPSSSPASRTVHRATAAAPGITGAGWLYLNYACSTRSLGGKCDNAVSMSARKLEARNQGLPPGTRQRPRAGAERSYR